VKDENTGSLKDRAERLFGAGKFRRSLKLYNELIRREPADPRMRVRRGELKRRLANKVGAAHDYLDAARLYAAEGYGARARAARRIAEQLAPNDDQVMIDNVVLTPAPVQRQANTMKPRRAIALGADTSWDIRSELPQRLALTDGEDPWATVPEGRWEEPGKTQAPPAEEPQERMPDLITEEEFQRMHGM